MWIRNKTTGTLQEIHNADVIKVCKKEPDKYELYEERPEDNKEVKIATQEESEEKDEEAEEVTKVAEEETTNAADEEGNTPQNYEEMKLNDLRKIAKEKGVQGYNNMDKATIIAVIQAH